MEHIAGRPVGRTAYAKGCRCPECRESNRVSQDQYRHGEHSDKARRARRARTRAGRAAARLLAETQPEVWRRLLDEAYAAQGITPKFQRFKVDES